MSDIRNQLIKDSYDYVLQSDLGTGVVYRIGGAIPVNPIFQSGLTVTGGFTYSGAGEQFGYALLTDGTGYAYWGPISAATPSSGVTSITVGEGLSANSSTGAVTIVFTGSTGISGDYLPLSGGTVTGGTIFTNGLTANTISATTYYNLPVSGLTEGSGISITNNGFGNFTITSTATTSNVVQGITGITGTSGVSAITTNYKTTIINTSPDQIVTISGGTGITTGGTYPNFTIVNSLPDRTVTITGGTNIQITGTYPDFGINFTGSTTGGTVSGDYLPLSGGTVTGDTTFTSGLTANTISATIYYNLPKDIFVTGGTYANGTATFVNNSGGTFNVVGFPTATGTTTNYYGSFSDTTNQTVNGANTPTAWSANTTELSNAIYIVDGSKITVSNDGIYEIGYSAQIEKTVGGGDAVVTIWAKLNGNNVDRSSSTITLPNQSAYQLPFVSYIFDLYAGDQVEFYFSSDVAGVQITTLSGLTSPTRPVSPSLILVAKAIGNAVLSNSGDSYVTGFTLTNNNLTLNQNRVGQYSGFSVNLPYLNTSGGTINGNLNVTGSITASTYYGYGGYLTGISRGGGGGAGGQLYYFNISNTQSPYYEFSTTATTASEQSISATTGASQTAYVGGFMTPVGVPGITNFPAGILSFYLHCYDGANHNFNVYCELYKRTTGGSETLLFISDPVAVVGITTEMVISDGFFSGSTLDITDRLVVKIYATNISNQTRTIYFVSEGSQHYSFALTTIPTFIDTYVTGFTYSNNTFKIKQNNSQPDLTETINTMTGLTVNGNLTATTIVTTYLNSWYVRDNTGIVAIDVNNRRLTKSNGSTIVFDWENGILTGLTNLQSSSISATTYQNLPVSGLTSGNNMSVTGSNGNFTISFTGSIPTQGITGITGTSGVSAVTNNFETTIINTNPDKTVVITGGTNIQIVSDYPNFGINFTGTTGSNFTGGTVSGATIFTNGLTANTISATTYQNLPVSAVTNGNGISASTSNGTVTITNTDLGSSQSIFKNIQVGGVTQFSAGSNNSDLNFSGVNISITSAATNTLVFSGNNGTVTLVALDTGTSGTDVNVSNSAITKSGTITLNIPDASSTARGLVTTGTQTFGGTKNFSTLNSTTISATTYQNLPTTVSALTATDGISGSSTTGNITIINTDKGSSQNIFKNIQIGGITQFGANSNNSNLNFSGVNITITSAATNTLVFTNSLVQGITGITSGAGITATTNNNVTTITNLGVTGITAGYGISASTTTGAVTIIQKFDYGKAYTTGNNLNFI